MYMTNTTFIVFPPSQLVCLVSSFHVVATVVVVYIHVLTVGEVNGAH
jgi:hypothetical protein